MLFSYVSSFNIKKISQSKKYPLEGFFLKELQALFELYYRVMPLFLPGRPLFNTLLYKVLVM